MFLETKKFAWNTRDAEQVCTSVFLKKNKLADEDFHSTDSCASSEELLQK